jgi:hypothetical protein
VLCECHQSIILGFPKLIHIILSAVPFFCRATNADAWLDVSRVQPNAMRIHNISLSLLSNKCGIAFRLYHPRSCCITTRSTLSPTFRH